MRSGRFGEDRVDVLDTADRRERVLDDLRHVRLDVLGPAARVDRHDAHHRHLERRHEVDRKPGERQRPEEEHGEEEHEGRDRTAYR